MTYLTEDDLIRRAKLQAMIDQKDAARGRPLTAVEQLRNIERALAEHTSDCAQHHDQKCDCGADEFKGFRFVKVEKRKT